MDESANTRADDDSWDLATSVGATATMVAAARAMTTKDPRHLIDDPFAEPLVRAVGIPFFVDMLDGRLDTSQWDGGTDRVAFMMAGMAVRTRFFDEYFADAAAAGARQAVILASGLDSRAYRLAWPSGTVIYEVDQPAVIDFKTLTLGRLGAAPTGELHTVGVDLRDDWPTALQAAGFDPSAPTAWLAEGLLIYLPPEAQDRLLDTITELSVPGSAVATEYVPGIIDFDAESASAMSAKLKARGFTVNVPSLIYTGPRGNVMEHLTGLGWNVSGVPRSELLRRAGLPPRNPAVEDPLGEITYVSATLG